MGRKFALVIGNSEYADPALTPLPKAAVDATAVSALLEDVNVGAFTLDGLLVNERYSLVLRQVAAFFDNRSPEDTLLLYFSGHGVVDDFDEPYLAMQDTEKSNPLGTAVSRDFITKAMNRSRSQRQLLILDCCKSANFGIFRKGPWAAASAFKGEGDGRVIVAASARDRSAYETDDAIGPSENSVFTHILVTGIRTGLADSDGDGTITAGDLYEYLRAESLRLKIKQGPPQQYGDKAVERSVEIARDPSPSVFPEDLRRRLDGDSPKELLTAIADLEELGRRGNQRAQRAAVRELARLRSADSVIVSKAAAAVLKRVREPPGTVLWRRIKRRGAAIAVTSALLAVATAAGVALVAPAAGLYTKDDPVPKQTVLDADVLMERGYFPSWNGPGPRRLHDVANLCAAKDIPPNTRVLNGEAMHCYGLRFHTFYPEHTKFAAIELDSDQAELLGDQRPHEAETLKDLCLHMSVKPRDLLTDKHLEVCPGEKKP